MSHSIAIRQFHSHHFSGSFPTVDTYPAVDWDLLTAGDAHPFLITLAVAEIGRISQNGLVYDAVLVQSIAEQLHGSGGIRGHIAEGEESSAFPLDAVDWVGHLLDESGKLWAKGYIPPGETREHIRRTKARGGSLGTSIYGYGLRESIDEDKGHWHSVNFDLHSLDLAPAKMASLQLDGDFNITSETTQLDTPIEESNMSSDPITLNDIPETIREQIIAQAQLESDMARVQELSDSVEQLTEQVSELNDLSAAQRTQIAELTEARDAAQATIADYREAAFTSSLEARIAELTDWQVSSETGTERLNSLRATIRRSVLAELADNRDEAQVETAIQAAWDQNEVLVEALRETLSGPNVHYSQTRTPSGADSAAIDLTAEDVAEKLKEKYGK